MKTMLPILVKVAVEQTGFDPDAVDTLIYCVNTTNQDFFISTESESFTTVDEDNGDAVKHGSPPMEIKLVPGQAVQVANVLGWEWDGHIGIKIMFRETGSAETTGKNFDFKKSGKRYVHTNPGFTGSVLTPLEY